MKVVNTLVFSILLLVHESEIWNLTQEDENDWNHSRWNFLEWRDTQFLTTKDDILEELKVESVDEKLRMYSQTGYDM
jgi:hypothetical protein